MTALASRTIIRAACVWAVALLSACRFPVRPPEPMAPAAPAPTAASATLVSSPRTFANPMNIDYRFALDAPTRREAADPVVVVFKGQYYLFASKSGGYWVSPDLASWSFITPVGLPIEAYAPAVMEHDGSLYYTAGDVGLFRTSDPRSGRWEPLGQPFTAGDPDLFADDDGRVYLYYGVTYNGAISGTELDPNAGFRPRGAPFVCFRADAAHHGWERRGDDNLGNAPGDQYRDGPWIEGSWMTKHAGRYYLQYAAPGTEFKTYADGVYTSGSPRGPFVYQASNPFSAKPGGFISGAGHGATFRDLRGRYWHIATLTISVVHPFERRLGLFPARFDADGILSVDTAFGDFPQWLPDRRDDARRDNLSGAMLLSAGKAATASSSLDGFAPASAFDEEAKTMWAARSAGADEWLSVDLGAACQIAAVQVNFGEQGDTARGRAATATAPAGASRRYRLESSTDGVHFTTLLDRDLAGRDLPHDYLELSRPAETRHLRLSRASVPGGGVLAVRDLRVFGTCGAPLPGPVTALTVERDRRDGRDARVEWQAVTGADGYVVRFGPGRTKLLQSIEVRGRTDLALHGLNRDTGYFFTVDSFNGSGRTPGQALVEARTAH